jgi:hypothetical protein
MTFRSLQIHRFPVLSLLLAGALAHAATITGTVTNKTTNKPSGGDSVALVDVQAGMADVATATTDSKGQYSIQSPGMGAYLIRVNHQGAGYFIAAPMGAGPGDVSVYDVAAKLDNVNIDADMLLFEAAGGTLRVQERYLVRNRSLPPKAQFSSNTFEVVLPPTAELDGASATRPGGMATNTRLVPLGEKNHYTFNIPIQPDKGEKETMFEVQYHMPYSGKATINPQPRMPADNLVVYTPKSMTFSGSQGSSFQSVPEDPRVQTNMLKNVHPGQSIGFTISGEGQMPRDAQPSSGMGKPAGAGMGEMGSSDTSTPGNTPGGGIGNPIGTPDPLTKYKWWILGGLAVLLAAGAIFLLRKRAGEPTNSSILAHDSPFEGRPLPTFVHQGEPAAASFVPPAPAAPARTAPPAYTAPAGNATLLSILKDEMFAIESERINGTLSQAEYAEVKTGLEAVLKRALRKG